jgi:hypothetical protein
MQRCKYGVADKFGDLRHYGVSEGANSVQPMGNPISSSTQHGFSRNWPSSVPRNGLEDPPHSSNLPPQWSLPRIGVGTFRRCKNSVNLTPRELAAARFATSSGDMHSLLKSVFVGVGNDPDPIPLMRGADAVCWNAIPLRIIPERGQVPENSSHPETKQAWRVFHDDDKRSKFANEALVFRPKAATLGLQPAAKACVTKVLAWESPTNGINCNSIGNKLCCRECSDVAVTGDIGPMLGEDAAGVVFDFTERDRFEAVILSTFQFRALQAEREAANATEQIKNAQLHHSHPSSLAA